MLPDRYPLTRGQQRIWFLTKLNSDSLFYNISLVYQLNGPLSQEALLSSLLVLLKRHKILRANFIESEGLPVQIIRGEIINPLEIIDLSNEPAVLRSEKEEAFLSELLARPFDLAKDALFRAVLLTLEPEQHTLVFIMHHIITDMWSMDIFCQELSSLYNQFLAGKEGSLPNPAPQYTDYALEQNDHRYRQIQQEYETFWKNQIKDGLSLMALPYDRKQQSGRTFEGDIERITIAKRTYRAFRDLCREYNATLFVGLLAAYQIFLYRLTGQPRVVVGSFLANRSQVELEGMLGLLFNDLPIVMEVDGEQSFLETMAKTRRVILDVMNNADYPVDELAERLFGRAGIGRVPLYNVTFQLYHRNDRRIHLDQIEARQRRVFQGTKFDLMFYGSAAPDSLDIWFNYNSNLFDAATIKRVLHHFNTLMQSIVINPTARVSDFDLLTPEEQYSLSTTWNNHLLPYPRLKTIPQLFEIQARSAANLISVGESMSGGAKNDWTYEGFNRQANRLAHTLQERNIRRGTVVGVLLPRCPEIAIAHLAVLKAGGVCLLLDPHYPPARIRYMIQDSNAMALITTPDLSQELALDMNTPCIFLDQVDPKILDNNLPVVNDAEDIAFVVYTSGSTGSPKGVMLSHRSVISQVYHRIDSLNIQPQDRLCLSLSVAFSTLPMQLLVPLLYGLPLMIYNEETVANAYRLFQQVDTDGITLLELTVSTLSAYLTYIDINPHQKLALSQLRMVLTAGEKLPPSIVRRFYQHYPRHQLATTYGQSEAAGIMANAIIPNDTELQNVIEGYPSANNRIYLFDSNFKLAPIGVPGNVYFAGDGLASGYINKPQETASRFLPDPFVTGEKMINTGDIARRLPDGRIEVLGRADMMVKIRGNRVELGEVEKHLLAHPEVINGVIIARDDGNGSKELVAYYTSTNPIPVRTLQNYLSQQLPAYMVPNRIVRLAEIPLSPNRKVDRSALPDPASDLKEALSPAEAQVLSPMEIQLALLWCDVLGLTQCEVSADSSFFELGGHSLKAMELLARLHEKYNLVIPLKKVFSHSILRDMAQLIENELDEK